MATSEDDGGLIQVKAISVGPNMCAISEPLEISLDYQLAEAISGARWHISYLVDSVRRRHLVELGAAGVGPEDLLPNTPLSLRFKSGPIDVGHLKPSQLCNAGLLIVTLRGGNAGESKESDSKDDGSGDGLGAVQLVVQAMPASGGGFIRSILNPWE